MNFSFKRSMYEMLPLSVQVGIGMIPFHWVAGRHYRETIRRRDWIDRASHEDLKAYQASKLGAILRFATAQVPAYAGYRRVVDRYSPFDALKEFPLVSKEQIQEDIARYLPTNLPKIPHYECSTGGTSGNQLKFYLDDASQAMETAFIHRQWTRVGYTPRCRKATFRGVSFSGLKDQIYWQHNPIYNELQFSPFHMNDGTLQAYVHQLLDFRPSYLHGYPSAINILAEYIGRKNITAELPEIKAVLLGSEGCLPAQRHRIEQSFRTRVFSWYGHSERLILGGECELDATYHHFPDYGILEIIDDDGQHCTREGDRGELVGTGLWNFSMPLIRYRTGDYARRRAHDCVCGRAWDRFDQVEGHRKQDMIVGHSGSRISIAALNMHGPFFDKVIRYQYHQSVVGHCEIRVMPAPGFTAEDRQQIEHAYREKVGDEVGISVVCVEDIPLTARGKLRLLDSRI